jgi:hypothetical protein
MAIYLSSSNCGKKKAGEKVHCHPGCAESVQVDVVALFNSSNETSFQAFAGRDAFEDFTGRMEDYCGATQEQQMPRQLRAGASFRAQRVLLLLLLLVVVLSLIIIVIGGGVESSYYYYYYYYYYYWWC